MANLNSSIVNGFLRVIGKMKVNSLEVESNDVVANLNADLLDGKQGNEYASSTDLTALTTRMTTAEGNISTNASGISALNTKTDTTNTNLTNLTTRVGTAETDISNLKTKTDTTNTNLTNLTTRVTTAEGDIDSLETSVGTIEGNLTALTTRVGTNEDNISGLETKTDTTNNNLTALTTRVTTAETNISTAQTNITNLTSQVNTNTGNILQNMEDIQQNTEDIGTNKDDISSLKTRMTTAEGTISSHTTSISTLTTNLGTTNTNLSNLTTRVTTAEGDIDTLETGLGTTNTNLSNLSSQVSTNSTNIGNNTSAISTLQNRLTTDEATIADNTSRIDDIMEGTAEIPSVANAEEANNALKLGNQLPSYYATKTDLNGYLALTGGTVTGLTKFLGTAADNSLMVRGIRGSTSDGSAAAPLYLNYGNQQPVYINGENVVYHSGNTPNASTSVKGIVQLNDTHTSTSTTLAPTANALKGVYDTLNTALTTHSSDTNVHLTTADRTILTKANKFKGYYETETALNNAHPTGEAGDYAIVNTTDTVWIWDADKQGGAGWKDGAGLGSVISVNNMTGEVILTKSSLGLGNVDNTSDSSKPVSTAQQAALDLKVAKAGDTMTGTLDISGFGTTGQIRLRNGGSQTGYGALIRNDGTSTYFLLTNASDATGAYNSLRPIAINDSNGLVTIGNKLVSSDTTDSTSTDTGSLKVSGGIGVAKNIYTGQDVNIRSLIVRGSNTSNNTRIITSDAADNIYVSIGGAARVVWQNDVMRPSTSKAGVVELGSSTVKWKNLYLSNNAEVGAAVNAGTTVTAGTDLKTGSGKVNYNDKAYIQYNSTNECLEFVFA